MAADDPAQAVEQVGEIEAAVAESLRTGRFLLVVAAPEITDGVERVLHYMNAQGLRLFGLEVSYFNGPAECFVPRLKVPPAALDQPAATAPHGIWDEASVLDDLQRRKGEEAAAVARATLDWADRLGLRRWFGTGRQTGSCYLGREDERGYFRPFVIWSSGVMQIQFGEMASGKHPSFQPEANRRELQTRLNKIAGVSIPDDRLDKYPTIPLLTLADPDAIHQFLNTFEWALAEMNAA